MRHFDVQLIGGMTLHQGKIAEMRTGEGKTLVATLPAYLNALPGKGVHVVTVNEYLAQRDADWMGPVYRFLGLTVGVIKSGQTPDEKRAAYAADITYGTNNEFGFDYLRDNLAFRLEDRAQRGLAYAIVDEVDSILIDEARTPLIISGPAEESTELYVKINQLVPRLKRQESEEGEGDYWADEKSRQVHLSDAGHERAEELIAEAGLLQPGESLYDAANIRLMHHLNAALRAHALYNRDVEYIVRNGEVIIVDEFTGRTMPGRRWSDGLHQAVEAKEGVRVREENQTVASITFQNYFRMYSKLSGMTGTADTEAFEFQSDLWTGGRRDSDASTDGAQGSRRFRLSHGEGQVRRDPRGHSRLRDARSAGAGRHDLDRNLRAAVEAAREAEDPASSAERETARARSKHRGAGGSSGRRDDRDEHGRSRYRHRARRQSRSRAASDRRGPTKSPVSGRARNGRSVTMQ